MKSKIINFLIKWSGAGKAWDVFDGYKSYGGGVGLILAGVGDALQEIATAQSPADLVKVFQAIDWGKVTAGVAAIGLAHKIHKATN